MNTKDNNPKIIKDATFDNEELTKKQLRDELDLAYTDFNKRISSVVEKIRKKLRKKN